MNVAAAHKIKLLICIPTLQCGGTEKCVTTVCNNINTDKFEVTLIVLNNASPFYTITNSAIKIIDLQTTKARNALLKIRHLSKQHQPDIIFSVANHLNLLLAMFRWMFAKKIKILVRESSLVSSNIQYAKFPVLYRPLMKNFYNKLDHIICQSAAMQKDLVDNFNIKKNKTTVIHNSVENRNELKEYTTAPPYKFITVARLSPEKGIDRIIKALSLLEMPYQYHIVGDGSESTSLKKLVSGLKLENKIFFTGQKQEPFKGMEAADLFLFGSYYEGFPNAVLEANALGIPVVYFNAPGGISEIVIDGENGISVNGNDVQAFAAAIEKAIKMSFDKNKIAFKTMQRFSTPALIKEVEEVLLNLLNRHK